MHQAHQKMSILKISTTAEYVNCLWMNIAWFGWDITLTSNEAWEPLQSIK